MWAKRSVPTAASEMQSGGHGALRDVKHRRMRAVAHPTQLQIHSTRLKLLRREGRTSHGLRRRGVDLVDSAQTVGFGLMRSRDKGAAHLCAVPARYDAEAQRLFGLDVAWGKSNLHGVGFQWAPGLSVRGKVVVGLCRLCFARLLVGEPGKVREHSGDEISMMGVIQ